MEIERTFDSELWRAELGKRAAGMLKGENHVGDANERASRVAGRALRGWLEKRRQVGTREWRMRVGKTTWMDKVGA